MDGFTGENTATTDELRDAVAVTDPFYVVVEPGGVVDQQPPPLGQDRSVRGVPRHSQRIRDPGDAQLRHHEPLWCPAHRPPRELRPRHRRGRGALAPDVPATDAAVTPDRDLQHRQAPPEQSWATRRTRLSRGKPSHPHRPHHSSGSLTRRARTAPVGLQALPDHDQSELVEACEHAQVETKNVASAFRGPSGGRRRNLRHRKNSTLPRTDEPPVSSTLINPELHRRLRRATLSLIASDSVS